MAELKHIEDYIGFNDTWILEFDAGVDNSEVERSLARSEDFRNFMTSPEAQAAVTELLTIMDAHGLAHQADNMVRQAGLNNVEIDKIMEHIGPIAPDVWKNLNDVITVRSEPESIQDAIDQVAAEHRLNNDPSPF